jgi:hypothetical protein
MSYELINLTVDESNQDMYKECFRSSRTVDRNGSDASSESVWGFIGSHLNGGSIAISTVKANVTTDATLYGCNEESLNSTNPHLHDRVWVVGTCSVGTMSTGKIDIDDDAEWYVISLSNGTGSNVTNAVIVDALGKTR